jgi:hypothetical protein
MRHARRVERMMRLNESRARRTIAAVALAVTLALLVAIVLSSAAEAQRGGGGRGGGGGGGGKPSAPSKSSSGSGSSASKAGDKGLPQGVANPKSPYYNSLNYGIRHGAFSNFFLWAWIFHDFDDDAYEEEYVESNYSFGGWAILGVGAVGTFLLIRFVRRRSGV